MLHRDSVFSVAVRLFACLLLLMFGLAAQSTTGEITGTVTDSTGAVVPGATITVTNLTTNTRRSVESNTAGVYSLPALPPGTYTLRTEMPAFDAQVRNNITLQVSQVARIDIALKVGNVSEVVEVQGGAPVLETESTAVGTVIENQRIVELPLNGRNYLQLASLIPGANSSGAFSSVTNQRQGGTRSQFNITISGNRIFYNHYMLDGLENSDPNFNSYIFLPSLDALQEFKVETGIPSAEFGRNMNQINVTTKSGTNTIHGAAFEFLRNAKLDAKNYFDIKTAPIPPFKRNQFGIAIGGPVVIPHIINGRDKLFFMVSYEGLRERKALTQTLSVPPMAWRNGDFSSVPQVIYDPRSRVLNAAGTAVISSTPFENNIIPPDRVNSISREYELKWISPPTGPGTALNAINTEGRPTDNDQQNYRFDYSQTSNSNWMFRYSHSGETQYNPTLFPDQGQTLAVQAHQGMLSHTWIWGSNKVNQARFGISRLENNNAPRRAGKEDVLAELGVTTIPHSNPLYWGVPNFTPGGGFSLSGDNSDSPFVNYDTIIQLTDGFSWTKGKHNFKFGGEISRTRYNQIGSVVPRGRFSENGQYTISGVANGAKSVPANNIADWMLGLFSQYEGQFGTPIANYRGNYYALYAEDSWRIAPKLTLNIGLRWEYKAPWVDKFDNIVNVDFKWDNSMFPVFVRAGAGDPFQYNPQFRMPPTIPYVRDGRFGRGTNAPEKDNFAPRVGIAYSLNDKTVIRTGAGIFYVNEIGSNLFDIVRNPPISVRLSETANNLIPNLSWAAPFSPLNNIPSFALAVQYNDPTSYVGQWTFGVQRQLTRDMSLETTYVGTTGVYLKRLITYNAPGLAPGVQNNNRPFPIFLGGQQTQGGSAHSTYHALQAKLQQRLSHGFTMLNSFSYGKSIDDFSAVRGTGFDGGPTDPYNIRGTGRGLSGFDFRMRFTSSLLYQVPIGRGKALLGGASRALDAIVGGWQLGGIITLQDGNPFSVACSSTTIQNGAGLGCRPDAVPGLNSNLPSDQQDPTHFFNTAAFVDRLSGGAALRYGNAGRDVTTGPGIIDVDASVTKNFNFTERQYLEFRAEFFNIPNHPIFQAPGSTVGTGTYGVIGSTQVDSRQLQFGLKYVF
jgi:hypothetical protein